MKKKNHSVHNKNKNVKFGKTIEYKFNEKNDDFHISVSQTKNQPFKLEDNDIKENFDLYEERKIIENDEDNENYNQALMKVHRMSLKDIKKNDNNKGNLKKSNKKPFSIESEPVPINREKAREMAQHYFGPRLKYFNKLRMNSESNYKDKSDNITSRPIDIFNKIITSDFDIKADVSPDKPNNNNNNIKIINNNNTKKREFAKMTTDMYEAILRVSIKKDNDEKEEKIEKEKKEKLEKEKKEKEKKEREKMLCVYIIEIK